MIYVFVFNSGEAATVTSDAQESSNAGSVLGANKDSSTHVSGTTTIPNVVGELIDAATMATSSGQLTRMRSGSANAISITKNETDLKIRRNETSDKEKEIVQHYLNKAKERDRSKSIGGVGSSSGSGIPTVRSSSDLAGMMFCMYF